jgi:hypothetical protein
VIAGERGVRGHPFSRRLEQVDALGSEPLSDGDRPPIPVDVEVVLRLFGEQRGLQRPARA